MENNIKQSLSNMIKSNDIADVKLAIGIASVNEDFKDVWYNINDYITKDTIKYVELYSKEGKSDKVYIIIVNKLGGWKYNTISYFGKRGKSLRIGYNEIHHSTYLYNELKDNKTNKGYKIINEFSNI